MPRTSPAFFAANPGYFSQVDMSWKYLSRAIWHIMAVVLVQHN